MSRPDRAPLTGKNGAVTTTPNARRINVAVTIPMLTAIDRIIERENVTLTEAVRRLIAYGDFVYEAAKERDATLFLRNTAGEEREVVVL